MDYVSTHKKHILHDVHSEQETVKERKNVRIIRVTLKFWFILMNISLHLF